MAKNLIIQMHGNLKKFKRFLYRALVLALFVVAVMSGQSEGLSAQEASSEPLKIGTFLSITGQATFIGAPALATLKLYVELLNIQGAYWVVK